MGSRKNTAALSDDERQAFITAVLRLKQTTRPGSQLSIYDEFVAEHLGVTSRTINGNDVGDGAHGGSGFLAWHREYIRRFELALQAFDPSVNLPCWSWSDQAQTAAMFGDTFLGDRTNEVTTGPFSTGAGFYVYEDLHVNRWGDPTQGPALMRGNMAFSALPAADDIVTVLRTDDPTRFRQNLENLHNTMHVWVGGSMVMMTSPNDPIFFMHHAGVDRMWAMWQDHQHEGAGFYPPATRYGHRLSDRMWPWDGGEASVHSELEARLPSAGTGPILRVSDMLDYRAMGFDYDEQQGRLQINEPRAATINSAGESHSYALTVATASEFTFTTTGSTDVVMSLNRANGSRIVSDDDSANGNNATFTVALTPGEYRVIVRHYAIDGTGAYSVGMAMEDNDVTPDTSPVVDEPIRRLSVNGGELTGVIGAPGDVDWFIFDTSSAGSHQIETSGPTDMQAFIYGPNTAAFVTWDDDSGLDLNARIVADLAPGRYWVGVRHWSTEQTGPYGIRVRAS